MLQWREQFKQREKRLFLVEHSHIHNTIKTIQNSPSADVAMEGACKQGEKKVIQIKHTHVHNTRPFSKTHLLILAMEGTNKKKNRLNIHTYTT